MTTVILVMYYDILRWAGGGQASEVGNRLTRCGKEERL